MHRRCSILFNLIALLPPQTGVATAMIAGVPVGAGRAARTGSFIVVFIGGSHERS
jgi:hypothetical protein